MTTALMLKCLLMMLFSLWASLIVPFLNGEEPMRTSYDPTTRGLHGVVRVLGPLLLAFLALMMLAGCGNQPVKTEPLADVVLAPQKEKVNIPQETLRDCDPIPKLEDRPYKQKEITTVVNNIVGPYVDCRKRKRDAVNSIKDAFNISK